MALTITEALAEIHTIGKRLKKKREHVAHYLVRDEERRDPLLSDGGSERAIAQTRQAIHDLEERIVKIRSAIAQANTEHKVTICGETRTIADWLTWRREVYRDREQFLTTMQRQLQGFREKLTRQGLTVAKAGEEAPRGAAIVCVDESALAREVEKLEEIYGKLDGQLSLMNARIEIELDPLPEE